MISSPVKLRRSARVAGKAVTSLQVAVQCADSVTKQPAKPGPTSRAPRAASPQPQARPKAGFPSRQLEQVRWAEGHRLVAGVDEAGRGPLAGPVVAGACIMGPHVDIVGIRDSKLMTEQQRQQVFDQLLAHPDVVCATCTIDVEDIDELNILQAALKAMEGAVAALPHPPPHFLLVDGTQMPKGFQQQSCQTVVKGDTKSTVIAAASILAKVTRDRLMLRYHEQWPHYNFAQHKGYGTAAHVAAMKVHGPCPIHRRSFAPLRNWLQTADSAHPADMHAPLQVAQSAQMQQDAEKREKIQ